MKFVRILVIAALMTGVACKEAEKKNASDSEQQGTAATLKKNLASITGGESSAANGNSQQNQQGRQQAPNIPSMVYVGPDSAVYNCWVRVQMTGETSVQVIISNSCRAVLGYNVPVNYDCQTNNICNATDGLVSPMGSPSYYQPGQYRPNAELMLTTYTLKIGYGTMAIRVVRGEIGTGKINSSMEFPFVAGPSM